MAEQNTHSLDAAVEETIELAHQVIEQTRAEIARSQALSQAEADLAQAIEQIAGEHGAPADE
jgi:nicotinamide mononucleotide (NMN) deamidase PncC